MGPSIAHWGPSATPPAGGLSLYSVLSTDLSVLPTALSPPCIFGEYTYMLPSFETGATCPPMPPSPYSAPPATPGAN